MIGSRCGVIGRALVVAGSALFSSPAAASPGLAGQLLCSSRVASSVANATPDHLFGVFGGGVKLSPSCALEMFVRSTCAVLRVASDASGVEKYGIVLIYHLFALSSIRNT